MLKIFLTSLYISIFYSLLFSVSVLAEDERVLLKPLKEKNLPSLKLKIPKNPLTLSPTALVETTKGPIEISFFRETAPVTVTNFQNLVKKNFYNGLIFHRFVQDYVVQGGDPKGNGKGGPGYVLHPEFSSLKHRLGTIGMARKLDPVNPQRLSNGSQFYITLTDAKHFDGNYTIFAEVINGFENLGKIRKGDKILKILLPK